MSDKRAGGKGWDLTSLNSFTGGLNWVRKNGGALVVLAIRAQDVAFSCSPGIEPMEAITMLRDELPMLLQKLIAERAARTARKPTGRSAPERNLDAEDC